jgi:argininosuccinate lyase
MLMTDQAYELVQSGVPFREAYVKVKTLKNNKLIPQSTSRKHSSSGSAYNLDLKTLNRRLQKLTQSK